MVVWIAIAVLLIGVVAATTYAVIRAIQFYRGAKRVSNVLGAEVERVNDSAAKIEVQLRKAEEARARLQDAADRLAVSRAQLNVQVAAVREARAQVRRVFWFVPGI